MFSEDEQEKIIETFLDTIEARDMIRETNNRCRKCNCEFDNANVVFKKSLLSENIIEQVKGFNGLDTCHHKCDELKVFISKLDTFYYMKFQKVRRLEETLGMIGICIIN